MADTLDPKPATMEAIAAAVPQPPRTASDELRELQHIVGQFQGQLDTPSGVVGLHPLGEVNVEKARVAFAQACKRLREGFTAYRDTTLASWSSVAASSAAQPPSAGGDPAVAATNRVAAAMRELDGMRRVTDALHEDMTGCQTLLFDAAGDAVSRALVAGVAGPSQLLIERLGASARRLGLAHYTDAQHDADGNEMTTVTLAGSVSVVDVDIGTRADQLNVKVSYVLDMEHDSHVDALMLRRLRAGDIHGFEKLLEEMATLDKLTVAHPDASFIRSTFAVVATLAAIQKQELAALDGDLTQLLRYGSGIALPYMRHAGPSSVYFLPAAVRQGLTRQQWEALGDNTLEAAADLPGCRWLSFSWEPSSTEHFFLAESFPRHCVDAEYAVDDASGVRVVSSPHPTIHGLEMQFLEPKHPRAGGGGMDAMQLADSDDQLWLRYAVVARLEPELPACALTVRAIMAAASASAPAAGADTPGQAGDSPTASMQDSPRLLDEAPTLEQLVHSGCAAEPRTGAPFRATHSIGGRTTVAVELESPQIRAWSISRVPLANMRNVLAVVPLLRRQAVFNGLLASCFSVTVADPSASKAAAAAEPGIAVVVKTHASDPFRIDMCVRRPASSDAGQGVVLRVAEATSDILAWTHQTLGVGDTPDVLVALAAANSAALAAETAHRTLSQAASISSSIPIVAHWLASHADRL